MNGVNLPVEFYIQHTVGSIESDWPLRSSKPQNASADKTVKAGRSASKVQKEGRKLTIKASKAVSVACRLPSQKALTHDKAKSPTRTDTRIFRGIAMLAG